MIEKNSKKMIFFLEKIWKLQKNVLPLHRN